MQNGIKVRFYKYAYYEVCDTGSTTVGRATLR